MVTRTNDYVTNNTLKSVLSTSDSYKNKWFTVFNKNRSSNDGYLFNSIRSYNITIGNNVDHIYQSQINLENHISLFIENFYHKLTKKNEDDFHLLNYR